MNKKIAITGNFRNGELIIEILKFLGGANTKQLNGICEEYVYYINTCEHITRSSVAPEGYKVYTLEQLLSRTEETTYPRVMMVSNDLRVWHRRVVLYVNHAQNPPYVTYSNIESLEEIDKQLFYSAVFWHYAEEIEPTIELTLDQIAAKLNIKVENLKIIK